ncbi:MAG: excinuclease ABC subunit UvrC [Candidatus Cloacimonadia bacterium]
METSKDKIKKRLKTLPTSAGVYLMRNRNDDVIYVGKAVNLRNRVRSYFSGNVNQTEPYRTKVEKMASQVSDFDYIITPSEEEAFLLEANLIKEHRPKYNVSLKDDKQYPFIKITLHEPFPRISVDRDLAKDGSKYFGPYTDVTLLRKTLRTIEWIMPLRTCRRKIPLGKPIYDKPCLNYQLGKCSAPCIGKISYEEYSKVIKNVMAFLNGRNKELIDSLREEMTIASDKLEFEKAAKIRDQIETFEKLQRSQTVYFHDEENRDVIVLYREDKYAVVVILKVIAGKLLSSDNYRLDNSEESDNGEILAAFLKQYYASRLEALPHRVLLNEEPEEFESLNRWLKNKLVIPQRGDNRLLVALAKKNAFNYIESIRLSHMRMSNRTIFPVQELKDKLQLPKLPRRIACFDVSTIQGSDTVASVVFFENGKPLKRNYRHYIIKTVSGQDDYASLKEALQRYLAKLTDDIKPDLIVIDGGKGQLSTAVSVLDDFQTADISLISLAERVEEIYLPNNSEPLFLPRSSSALRLLVSIRDETHRFAINFHRKKRKDRTIKSELDIVKGVGKDKKFSLLKHFGSVERIRNSTIEELMQVKGIGPKTAEAVLSALNAKKD